MGLDLLIIILFLAMAMVGIHIFLNPIAGKKRKRGNELPEISHRRSYVTRRKRYRQKW